MSDETLPLFLAGSHVEVMLVCYIPKQVILNFNGKPSCGSCLKPPDGIKNSNLPEVMVLLSYLLKEGDPHSFWNLVSISDKTIKQPELLVDVTEKLSGGTFGIINKAQVCDVCGQGDNFMLYNIQLLMIVILD